MEYNLKNAHRGYLQNVYFEDMVAVTLSMKQYAHGHKLDNDKAIQNLSHFMNLMNKKAFGNAFTRYGKRLSVVPILERSMSHRLHYHLAIDNPYPNDPMIFDYHVHTMWRKTDWGYSEIDIQHDANSGWINYITKFNSHDEVDWKNFYQVR